VTGDIMVAVIRGYGSCFDECGLSHNVCV